MAKMHVKKGDTVRILTGKDRGKQGKIIHVFPAKERVTVEGINMIKKAMRPTQQNPSGGISTMEAPVHVSNVMLVCPHCNQATRVSHQFNEDGEKVRVCKKCSREF